MSDQKSVNSLRLSLFEHEITIQSWNFSKKRFAKESLYSHQNNTNFLRELMKRMNYIYIWMVPSLMKHGALNCLKCMILVSMEMFAEIDETRNLYVSLCFFFFLFFLSCVHTMPHSFSWRHEKLSGIVWIVMARGKTKLYTHIQHSAAGQRV